mmetsp:Transcript_2335/g.3265  ORF Transcript_2335/g.3265 Transcript_2335/m.3265 type:complete len:329 (+) Transcript_2335:48-1034(+)
MNSFQVVATGLDFPEGGPIWLRDGSLLLVEIKAGTLIRIYPNGKKEVIAKLGGGPNSCAVGPNGHIYVTQNGGFEWLSIGKNNSFLTVPTVQASDYKTGSIQVVELSSTLTKSRISTLFTEGIDTKGNTVKLKGPNDLVFDRSGGFWFTDHGKSRERERDITGVFYVDSRGESCREVVFPLNSPNGIGLSPNGSRLYVAETLTGRLFAYDVISPGKLKTAKGNLIYSAPEGYMFDSLAVDSEGNICVATLGRGSWGTGGISVIKENGTGLRNFITTGDFFTTNICFGGIDLQDAYITLSGTGKLVKMRWHCPGHRCNFEELLHSESNL